MSQGVTVVVSPLISLIEDQVTSFLQVSTLPLPLSLPPLVPFSLTTSMFAIFFVSYSHASFSYLFCWLCIFSTLHLILFFFYFNILFLIICHCNAFPFLLSFQSSPTLLRLIFLCLSLSIFSSLDLLISF